MKGIFDLILFKNYNIYILLFFTGLFVLECFFLYSREYGVRLTKKIVLAIGMLGVAISAITILQTDFPEHDYKAQFSPKNISCLLEAYEESWSGPHTEYVDVVKSVHEACTRSFYVSGIYQILLLMCFFAIGWIICKVCFEEESMLDLFMAFPIGICTVGAIGLAFHIIGIPINRITLIIAFIIAISVLVLKTKRDDKQLHFPTAIKQWAIAMLMSAIAVLSNLYFMTHDGVVKTFIGFELAELSISRADFLKEVEYGILEPVIHCIGWEFSVEFIYGMYVLMPVCSIGILLTSICKFTTNKRMALLFAGIGAILLATNHDMAYCATTVLSNGMMGTFTLAMLIFFLKMINKMGKMIYPIAILSWGMIIVRIEASCYICLLMVLLCGFKEYRENNRIINWILGIEMIVWQIYMLLFAPKDLMFWNPGRSFMVIGIAVVSIAFPYLFKIKGKVFEWVCKYYYVLAIVAFVVVGAGEYFVFPDTYFDYLKVFVSHFAASVDSNSLAIWGFTLIMMPVMLKNKDNTTGLMISYVVDFLLATFVIYACRTNEAIHFNMHDSVRRVMTQIMPTAMFAIAYIIGNLKFDAEE